MARPWLFVLCALITGCAHPSRPEVAQGIAAERCEEVAELLSANPLGPPAQSRVRQLVALPLSYVATGLGYTMDVVLFVGGGVVVGGVVCSPIIALEAASSSGGNASGKCVEATLGAFYSNAELLGAGRGLYAATKSWRCVDLTPMSEELRSLARCYARRGQPGDVAKAAKQLLVLRRSPRLYDCVSDSERHAIDADLAEIQESRASGTATSAPAAGD